MGGADIEAGETILNHADIPTFGYPDTAARVFDYMWRYSYNLRGIYETPVLPAEQEEGAPDRSQAEQIIQRARESGRTILTEFESKQLLAAYGIPTVPTRVAVEEEAVVRAADEMGYPVVLKLFSETITHKTDVGGVQLNLQDAAAVRRAYRSIRDSVSARAGVEHFQGVTVQPMISAEGYELIIGSSIDAQFGPVLLFGSGGQLVEVFQDRALALPPLNTTLARRMMEQTIIFKALQGVRGRKPVDLVALEQLLVRFSQLVVEQRWIKEIDINPLLASPERLLALDARVVVHGMEMPRDRLPKLAVRPYPRQYVKQWTMKDGTPATFRPIRPEDEPAMIKFHETLSDRSVYLRFLHPMMLSQRVAHDRLSRICFVDYEREIALVAESSDPQTGERRIMAAGRLSKLHGKDEAMFTMLVNDLYQGRGVGRELLRQLLDVARAEKLKRVVARISPDNTGMQRLCESLGFRLHRDPDSPMVDAEIAL
jgi:acetyltransferase